MGAAGVLQCDQATDQGWALSTGSMEMAGTEAAAGVASHCSCHPGLQLAAPSGAPQAGTLCRVWALRPSGPSARTSRDLRVWLAGLPAPRQAGPLTPGKLPDRRAQPHSRPSWSAPTAPSLCSMHCTARGPRAVVERAVRQHHKAPADLLCAG